MGIVITMKAIEKLASECAALTDINAHNEAAMKLAEALGNERELNIVCEISNRAEKRGFGDQLEITTRDYVVSQIIKRQENDVAKVLNEAF